VKLSVFSCWYNRLHDLEESVQSVLDQQGVEFEYIILDDASTDGTYERLAAISHPRLRLIRNETNIGFTRSAIRAVEACCGDYVAFHDAGDISFPGRMDMQVAHLDANPDVVAVGCRVENHVVATGERWMFSSNGDAEIGLEVGFTHGEVMFRSAAYNQVGGYRSVFYHTQDKDLWLRLQALGRLALVDELLYERRIFDDGVQGDPVAQIRQGIFANLMAHTAFERLAGRPDPVERYGALSLLTQPATSRFLYRVKRHVPALLKSRRFGEARRSLEMVPAGMLTTRTLALLLLLRPLTKVRNEDS
jgi:hypothetical protein